jgi:hypothetical protein
MLWWVSLRSLSKPQWSRCWPSQGCPGSWSSSPYSHSRMPATMGYGRPNQVHKAVLMTLKHSRLYLHRLDLNRGTALSHAAAPGPISLTNWALPAESPADNFSGQRASAATVVYQCSRQTHTHTDLNKIGWPSQQSRNKKIANQFKCVNVQSTVRPRSHPP